MAELHALGDLLVADLLGGAPLAHIILLLRPLGPVGGGAPHDGGQTPVLLNLTSLDGLGALLCVPVLVVTHVTLQTAHCKVVS